MLSFGTYPRWLVATKRFTSAQLSCLMKGHTHLDQDQRFSDVGAKISSSQILECPQDFVEVIKEKVKGSKGRLVHAETVGGTHFWSDWFENLGVDVHGHTGPDAPHVFRFVRCCDLLDGGPDSLIVDRAHWPLAMEAHEGDVLILVGLERSGIIARVIRMGLSLRLLGHIPWGLSGC